MKKFILSIIVLILSATVSQGQTCIKARYNLDGNATDASGNSLNGVLNGTSKTKDHFGNTDGALQFNGTSDQIKLGSSFDYPQRSISIWVKIDKFPTTAGAIYACDNPNLTYGLTGITAVNVSSVNKIKFNVGTNIMYYNNAATTTWYHLAMVVNSTHVKCFVNGKLIDSLANNSFIKSSDGDNVAHLGSHRNGAYNFTGAMDDARIFDCALSNAEINKIYNETQSKDTSCFEAWYKLDGNSNDALGKYNGSLTGTAAAKGYENKANTALKFNGSSDYVALGSSFDFAERTISLWVNAEEFTTTGNAIYACDNNGLNYGMTGITAVKVSGINKFRFNVGANHQFYSNASTNTWYHLAFVVNSSHAKCFVNGKFIDSLPNNSFLKSNDGDNVSHLGAARNGGYYFKGSMDEVKIYDCAMSRTEIEKLAFAGKCKALYSVTLDTTQKFKLFLINKSTNDSGTSYYWDFGDSTYSSQRNPRHNYSSFGRFKVCLTVTNGACSSSFCDSLGLDSSGKLYKAGLWQLISVDEGESLKTSKTLKTEIKVYPNPANDKITVIIPNSEGTYDGKVSVYSVDGRLLIEQLTNSGMAEIPINGLSKGMYILKYSNSEHLVVTRIIKE